jgi:hypothetical protein
LENQHRAVEEDQRTQNPETPSKGFVFRQLEKTKRRRERSKHTTRFEGIPSKEGPPDAVPDKTAKSGLDALGIHIFFPGMGGKCFSVAKIQVPQIDGKGQQILQDSHRILPVKGKITQAEQASQKAALPKTEGNYTFFGALGGDPLQEKPHSKDRTA